MTPDEVRTIALALPGTSEQPHFERTSFRAGTRIFVTMPPDGASVNVFVGEEEARAAAQEHPEVIQLLWWGAKLSGITVDLARADRPELAALVGELIEDAWRGKAPKRTVAAYDAEHPR